MICACFGDDARAVVAWGLNCYCGWCYVLLNGGSSLFVWRDSDSPLLPDSHGFYSLLCLTSYCVLGACMLLLHFGAAYSDILSDAA
jgi:hypothetical protein